MELVMVDQSVKINHVFQPWLHGVQNYLLYCIKTSCFKWTWNLTMSEPLCLPQTKIKCCTDATCKNAASNLAKNSYSSNEQKISNFAPRQSWQKIATSYLCRFNGVYMHFIKEELLLVPGRVVLYIIIAYVHVIDMQIRVMILAMLRW